MIAVASSVARERAALVALCESRGWPALECDSVRTALRALRHAPRVVIVRHKLTDGYSDDVLARLRQAGLLGATKVITLIAAGTSSALEARQLALGADCVQRDPVRIDVLLAYLGKYYTRSDPPAREPAGAGPATAVSFARARVSPMERTLRRGAKSVRLTPREMALVLLFAHSGGAVLTYEVLYSEVLGRRFRGDTTNMRVLLRLLTKSLAALGIPLRRWITVISKTGYRYEAPPVIAARVRRKTGTPLLSAA